MKRKGSTLAHFVARNGYLDTIRYLKESGVNIDLGDKEDTLTIHCAAQFGHLNIIEYLASQGADLEKSNSFGSTIAHYAAEKGHLNIIEYLTDNRVNINLNDERGSTSLHYAAASGHLNVIEYLADNGIDINYEIDGVNQAIGNVLEISSEEEKMLGILTLIAAGAIPSEDQEVKIKKFSSKIISILSENKQLITPKLAASKQIFDKALSEDGTVYTGGTLLSLAATRKIEIVASLVEAGADINETGGLLTPLLAAVHFGRIEIARYLIEKGALIDYPENVAHRPIEGALKIGEEESRIASTLFLLSVEALTSDDQNARIREFSATKVISVLNLNKDFITHKLATSSHVFGGGQTEDGVVTYGYPLLNIAAIDIESDFDVFRLLVENGADFNQKDKHQLTVINHVFTAHDEDVDRNYKLILPLIIAYGASDIVTKSDIEIMAELHLTLYYVFLEP